ncbi:MFS family permease [Mycolicibacterium sp. BK556]|uniref:MFS transporter n=1 Tax=unclassified Mycolicibacterium TaxID=2636767 RepID=UPI00160FDF54|nr:MULTISPECIES: MFS transporter [unclassified Mycolicibacterium]MBB3605305.1 MFS family permease [Mycolicibacterium sp. BK556]MBB3635501.1 MFS family permease [Mycolicibacterium sp. BK607]
MIGTWLKTLVPEPGARRRLGLGTGIYNIGTGMFMTSSVLYFTEGLGLSVTEVGLWLAVAGLIGLFAGVPMGHLADRRGPRGVAALSLVVLAATMVAYVFVSHIWMFVVVTVVEMLATAASRASRGGLIRRVGGEGAAAYRSQLRAIENAGVGIGAAIGGLALTLHTLAAYQVLFIANAATFLVGALVTAMLPYFEPLPAPPGTRPGVALRDKPFIAYTILNGVMSLQYAVITFALPLWIATETNAPRWMVGAVLLVNTIGVVALQVWVGKKVHTVRQGAAAMRVAGLVFLIACGGVAISSGLPGWASAAVLLVAVAVHSVGEMCHAAAVFALSFELAPAHAQSEYVGLQDMGLGAAFAVAPAVLGFLCLGIGQVGWLMLGGMLTAAGLATVPVVHWAIRSRPFPVDAEQPAETVAEPATVVLAAAPFAVRPPARLVPQTTVQVQRNLEHVVLDDASRFILDRDCVVGRDPHQCDAVRRGLRPIQIDVRSNGMSRAHLEIRSIAGQVYVIDRESRNGVAIRAAGKTRWTRIAPWKPVAWLPGMSVRIGSRILRLEANIPAAVIAGPPSSQPTVRIPVTSGRTAS